TLLYCLPEAVFNQLYEQSESFADFVEVEDKTRLRQAVSRQGRTDELLTSTVRELITRAPVIIHQSASVLAAAKKMTEESVSSILVLEEQADAAGPQRVAGMLTDQDLRTRVLAESLPNETAVAEVMSQDPITLESHQFVFEAMLTM